MKNKIKYLIVSLMAMAVPMGMSVGTVAAQENLRNGVCAGANLDATQLQGSTVGTCDDGDSTTKIDTLIKTIINVLTWVVGIVSVIMIIYGGLSYITSSGDSGKVTNARNTILYAIVGLVFVILAQVIVRFVLTNFGTD